MARGGELVEKYVKGRLLTQRQFLDLIVEKVKGHGEAGAKARDIAEALDDPNWLEPDNVQLIARTLTNLKNREVLENPARGVYRFDPEQATRGVTYSAKMEHTILETLIEHGGGIKLAKLARLFDCEPNGSDATYRALLTVLARSQKIVSDPYRHGFYVVHPVIQHMIPLHGHAAFRLHVDGFRELGGDTQEMENEGAKSAQDFFRRLGRAIDAAMALRETSAKDLAAGDPIWGAVVHRQWLQHPERAALRIAHLERYDLASGKEALKLRAGGATDPHIVLAREAAEKDWESQSPSLFLDLLIRGDVDAHRLTNTPFWEGLAKGLHLCPLSLSRGLLLPGHPALLPMQI